MEKYNIIPDNHFQAQDPPTKVTNHIIFTF